jgi:molybdate transport repressor ModE-like protein
MTLMDRRQIHYFTAIVNSGSMVNASRLLRVSQPSLSVVVQKLEKEIGTQLLVRTPHGVVATEAGRHLADVGQRILNDFDDLERHLRDAAAGRTGHITVACTPSYTWRYTPELLRRLSTTAPGIELELRDPPPLQIVGQVLDGAADVGIVATYDPDLLSRRYGDLDLVVLGPMPLLMAVPPGLDIADGAVSLAQMVEHPWVVPTTSTAFPGLAQLTERVWADHRLTPQAVREVSTAQTAVPLVAGGMGVALMPETVMNIAVGSIQTRGLAEDVPDLRATLVTRSGHPLTPATRQLIDIAVELGTAGQE